MTADLSDSALARSPDGRRALSHVWGTGMAQRVALEPLQLGLSAVAERVRTLVRRPAKRAPPTQCYFVVSLGRTGHHAFIDWFARALDQPVAFFNNALPSRPPALRTPPHYYGNHPHLPGATPLACFRACDNATILNFEGRMVDLIDGPCKASVAARFDRSVSSIYFLRDPLNCFASQIAALKRLNNSSYLRIVTQVVGFESIIEQVDSAGLSDRLVSFSGWRFDEEERQAVARRLGVANPAPPGKISKFGSGSSFRKDAFDPNTARDDLLSRWRLMLIDPRFLAIFRDPSARASFRRYFAIAGERELLDASTLDEVCAAADRSELAAEICETKLQPFRRATPLIRGLQQASTRPMREYYRARLQMATGLWLHND